MINVGLTLLPQQQCPCNNQAGAQRTQEGEVNPGQQNEGERPVGRTQTSGLFLLGEDEE